MIVSAGVVQGLKYGFITLVVSCAGYLIANITVVKHLKGESIDDLVYKPQISQTSEGSTSMLDKGFEKCLTRPSTTFCLLSANKRISLLRSKVLDDYKGSLENKSSATHHQHPITSVLRHFSQVARSVDVKPVLLEPSMLFCMMSPVNKVFLLTQHFNPSRHQGSRKVVTVGITEEESKLLDEEDALNVAMSHGFQVSRVRRWTRGSSFGDESTKPDGFYTIHYFFTRRTSIVHVVVFFGKKSYLWHENLYEEDWGIQNLLYIKDAAYDNFVAIPLEAENNLDMDLYLPSNPVHFMLQIETSERRSCSMNASEVFHNHPTLTRDQMQNRVVIAIKELEATLQPHFVGFWLWAKSLNGWYKDCNIFHATSELNLAAFHTKLEKLNLSSILMGNEYLKVIHHFSIDDKDAKFTLDCYGLRVNMFVAFEDEISVRFYEDTHGNEQPNGLVYPEFRLCSTDIFGQKVHVPCEPEVLM